MPAPASTNSGTDDEQQRDGGREAEPEVADLRVDRDGEREQREPGERPRETAPRGCAAAGGAAGVASATAIVRRP